MYKGNKVIIVVNRATNLTKDAYVQDVYLDENYTVADLLKDNTNNKLAINKLQEKQLKNEQNFSTMKDLIKNMVQVMVANNLDCTVFAEAIKSLSNEETEEEETKNE